MALEIPQDSCFIAIEDNMQVLYTPEGNMIPRVVWTRVYDPCDGAAYVIAKILVNLKDSPNAHTKKENNGESRDQEP